MLSEGQRALLIDCCRELVRIQSLPGSEGAAAELSASWMRRLGYDSVEVDEYGSVVGRIAGAAGPGPRLHFDGHLDTVPATDRDAWRHDPFAADLADGAIWGRGAADMKGPLAAMICAAAWTPRERLRGSLTVSASVAEEVFEGAALQAILARYPADMVVIGEPTLLRAGIGQKGRAGIRVTAQGRLAHSSAPQEGDNAVYRMLDAVARLRALAPPEDALLGPGLMELVEIVSSPFPGTGMVPDRCDARWDRRLVRGETRAGVLEGLRAALAGLPQVEVSFLEVVTHCYTGATLRGEDFHPAWELPADSPLAQAALAAVERAGLAPSVWTAPYCTNGSRAAVDLGLPTIIIGPGDPAVLHVADEHITLDQLERGAAVYAGMIAALC
ncbi:MAG TPA: YgeY family selenium metabolism-linked hydrolase [Roseiflexaceae bacterium]|nr:YgeY family selenium metabolism-linked hydrolase [Roseiflexaceae bacterium]